MKTKTQTSLLVRSSLALSFALALWFPLRAQTAAPMEKKMTMDGKMMAGCQEMMAKKDKLAADMKKQDADLTEQVAKMNRASGNERNNIMAAVVTHLLEQRIAMDARKAKLEEEMMSHMMEHMQMGAASMAGCPMMKNMGAAEEKSADAHKEHH